MMIADMSNLGGALRALPISTLYDENLSRSRDLLGKEDGYAD